MATPWDVVAARALYGVHMVSMPCWVGASAWALWKQRDVRAEYGSSRAVGPSAPTKCEYWGVRLLALYVAMDAMRAMDLCFDSTDGVCRAVWGFVPWWFRCTVWVVRDMALLGAIGNNLSFYIGWTFEALEWDPPQTLQSILRNTLGIVLCAVAASFWALMATNRQSWQVVVVMFVVGLNLVWAFVNCVLLKQVIPALEDRLQTNKSLPPWVQAAVEEVRLTAKLVLVADIAILVLFPLLALDRIVFKNAHHQAFFPGAGLDEWVGNTEPPLMMQRPDGIVLIPFLEVVELLIGWLQFVYVLRVGGACVSSRAPCRPTGGWIDEATLGGLFRCVAFGIGKKSQ